VAGGDGTGQEEKIKIIEEEKAEARERREIWELKLERLKHAQGIPNLFGAIERFKESLLKVSIANPEKRVMDMLVRRFPMQMAVAADYVESALDLYNEIKSLPSTTTLARIRDELQIYLNGPFRTENVNILIGSRSDKTPVIVKILVATAGNASLSKAATFSEACRKEAEVCVRLGLSSMTLPFVRSEIFEIEDTSKVVRTAIIMPIYVRTVADSARLWPASLVDGTARMMQALEHMHSLGLVHMDVKGSNILIDQAGEWYNISATSALPATSTSL